MSLRQIVLDTETTGLKVEEGHRIIEIGCLELMDRRLTGRSFHHYINPAREVEAAAIAIHGITNEKLKDKPLFHEIAEEFVNFVRDSEIIIHNAPFDVGFLNVELALCKQGWKSLPEYCDIFDTLPLARQLHVGQRNNLDALCKRYGVDSSKRDYHGALLDASLLAQVYLAMTGGQGSFFDALTPTITNVVREATKVAKQISYSLTVLMATEEELQTHQEYLKMMNMKGNCLWTEE